MTQLRIAVGPSESAAICDVTLGEGCPPDTDAVLQEHLEAFAIAATGGLFSGKRHDPATSSFVAIAPPPTSLGERRRWRYHAESLDLGSYRVLFNMIENQWPGAEWTVSIDVLGTSANVPRVIETPAVTTVPYPGTLAAEVFAIEDRLLDPTSRETIVRVDFRAPLGAEDEETAFSVLDSWEGVVRRGGYPGPSPDFGAGQLLLAEHYLVSPSLVEFAVYNYIAPLQSYDALLNGLHGLHRRGLAIGGVELE